MSETLAHGYSSGSTQRVVLSNEYQHDRVGIIFKNPCALMLWMEVALSIGRVKMYVNVEHCDTITYFQPAVLLAGNNDVDVRSAYSQCARHSQSCPIIAQLGVSHCCMIIFLT